MSESRVRVLQIVAAPTATQSGSIGVNGPERRAANVIREWASVDTDVVVAYPRRGKLWRVFSESGCDLEDFEIRGKTDLGAIRTIRCMIQKHRIDVVHTQGPESLDAIGAWASMLSGRPFIFTRPLMSEQLLHRSKFSSGLYQLVDRATVKIAKYVVTVSRAGFDHMRARGRRNNEKARLIYNGVDLTRFCSERAGRADASAVTIGMVAQLTPPKGWLDFLETIAALVQREGNVRAYIIGDGPLRATIESEVRSRGLESYVRMVGHTDDVALVLRELDIFLFTSHREGLSVAILEAMATGLPIVATDTGGTREQVVDEMNGFIVPCGDVPSLIDRTLSLVRSPELRIQFGLRSRERAEQKFSQESMVRAYAALYRASIA